LKNIYFTKNFDKKKQIRIRTKYFFIELTTIFIRLKQLDMIFIKIFYLLINKLGSLENLGKNLRAKFKLDWAKTRFIFLKNLKNL
jgi:hypothetical protein